MVTYYDIQKDMNSYRLEVQDMDDEDLVDEVNFITYYESGEMHSITKKFFTVSGMLTDEERKSLIDFYINGRFTTIFGSLYFKGNLLVLIKSF